MIRGYDYKLPEPKDRILPFTKETAMSNASATVPRPFANSYWVTPGRLLAGEYPSAFTATAARRKVHRLLDAGVTFFLDLTHPDDPLEPYTQFFEKTTEGGALPVVYRRLAIPDRSVPPAAQMTHQNDAIPRRNPNHRDKADQ